MLLVCTLFLLFFYFPWWYRYFYICIIYIICFRNVSCCRTDTVCQNSLFLLQTHTHHIPHTYTGDGTSARTAFTRFHTDGPCKKKNAITIFLFFVLSNFRYSTHHIWYAHSTAFIDSNTLVLYWLGWFLYNLSDTNYWWISMIIVDSVWCASVYVAIFFPLPMHAFIANFSQICDKHSVFLCNFAYTVYYRPQLYLYITLCWSYGFMHGLLFCYCKIHK